MAAQSLPARLLPAAAALACLAAAEPTAPEPLDFAVRVLVRGTREPLAGAVVLDAAGVALGETDPQGRARLRLAPGVHRLRLAAARHEPLDFDAEVRPGAPERVLRVVAVAGSFQATVRADRERAAPTQTPLDRDEIRRMPGALGDPLRALSMLPGAAGLGTGLGYPVLRGLQPAAVGTFVDGVRIPVLYHLLAGPAVVPSEFVESVTYLAGAPPAEYGRVLGGVVEVQTARPRADRWRGVFSADLVNLSAFAEGPVRDGTSVAAALRFGYTGLAGSFVANLLSDESERGSPWTLGIGDYQVRVDQRAGKGSLRLFVFGALDRVDVPGDETMAGHGGLSFHRADLRYRGPALSGDLEIGVAAGRDRVVAQVFVDGRRVNEISFTERLATLRAAWSRPFGERLALGLAFDLEPRLGSTVFFGFDPWRIAQDGADALREPDAAGAVCGLAAQATWRPSEDWTLLAALRLDGWYLRPGTLVGAVDPRLSARRRLGEHLTLKAGAALAHQPPTALLPLPVVELSGLRSGLQSAVQVLAGVDAVWARKLSGSLDLYFEPLPRTVEFDPLTLLDNRRRAGLAQADPATRGRAWGAELLLRTAPGGPWSGWLSYAYQRSLRWRTFERYDARNHPVSVAQGWLPFAFEQQHVLNLSLARRLGAWSLGATAHFNTGRPETGELSSRTRVPGAEGGLPRSWVRVDLDRADRLPPWWRVDARVARTFVFDTWTMEAYLDVYNASFTQEIVGWDYRGLERRPLDLGLVPLPMLGVRGAL